MSEITPEKTHRLLEKLADYVMSNLPTRAEMNAELAQKADKKDVEQLEEKMDTLLNGMEKQASQLDLIRTEQTAFNHGFKRLEKRVEEIEKAS